MCFETTSLQATATNADKWMRSYCIHCITWMMQEIEQHKHLINEDELWYETNNETSTQGDNYTIGNACIDLFDIEDLRRINENTLSEGCSKEKIKEIQEIMDSPDLCLHEDYSKEAKRFFDQKEKKGWPIYKTRKAAIKKIQALHEEDDPNTSKFHKRIYEELQGNFFKPNLQPTFLNTARRNLESKILNNAENYGWLMVLGKTHPCFYYHKFFKTYPEAFRQIH